MSSFLRRQASFFSSKASSPSSSGPAMPSEPLPSNLVASPPTSIPIVHAPASYKPTLSAPLSASQQSLLEKLAAFALELHADGKLKQDDVYFEYEERWVKDEGNLKRYARAGKWNEAQAKKMFEASLNWRRDWRPELIPTSEIAKEAETGKQVISGFDREGRPIIFLRPSRENTSPSIAQVRYLSYVLERAIEIASTTGADKLNIVIDYKQATQAKVPPWSIATKVLSMLQNHYVERLHRAYVVNTPWWMQAFFSALSPLLDPVTKDKVHMSKTPDLSALLPSRQLEVEFGGRHNLVWEFDDYWRTIHEACGIVLEEGEEGLRKRGERKFPDGQGDALVEDAKAAFSSSPATTTTTTPSGGESSSKAPSTAQTSFEELQPQQQATPEEKAGEADKAAAEPKETSTAPDVPLGKADEDKPGASSVQPGAVPPALPPR